MLGTLRPTIDEGCASGPIPAGVSASNTSPGRRITGSLAGPADLALETARPRTPQQDVIVELSGANEVLRPVGRS